MRARLGTAIEPDRMAGMCTVGTVSTGRLYLEAWSTTATRGASGNPAMSPNALRGKRSRVSSARCEHTFFPGPDCSDVREIGR